LRITDIECHVLLDPDFDTTAASSARDDFVVEVHTDEGITGIGETDVNPWIARACIESPGTHNMGLGIKEMLVGADPLDVDGIWQRLYTGSAMNGRRGAVINAIGAIDIALHDLRGKALGRPCHSLMGGAKKNYVIPYASLQPEVSSFEDYRDSLAEWAKQAKTFGFRAVKAEVTLAGPFAHKNVRESWERSTEVVAAVRSAVGEEITLFVDVQYAFPDADTALRVLRDWEPYEVAFVETPLWPDDLAGYARLATEQAIPIAAGEWLTTRFEFSQLIDVAKVSIAQPDIGRVGGLSEALKVAEYAQSVDRKVIPHLWKSGLSVATAIQFAAVTPNCDYIEFLPSELSESAIRQRLTTTDISMDSGRIPVPDKPGLGVEIDRAAMQEFEDVAAHWVKRGRW
jgi:L-alanine-DL-glutamate epimerase-like enolase superfamily enzyme